jgi:hypothetical protein
MATKRSPYDFYPTPKNSIDSLLDRLNEYGINLGKRILEPCAGDGALIRPIWMKCGQPDIQAYDIDESHLPQLKELCDSGEIFCYGTHDVLTLTQKEFDSFDTIITNPPFSISLEILEHLLYLRANSENRQPATVIILQRLGFLGSQKRHEFWNKYPPDAVWALSKRPSFTGNGTDAHEYGWFIWGNIKNAPPIIAI